MSIDLGTFFSRLDAKLADIWKGIFESSRLVHAIESGTIDRRLYAIYMMETFHYTSHNAKNQALVALRDDIAPVYAKFCLEHAAEEVGHEKMALHDIAAVGVDVSKLLNRRPLHETECLIAYLYWIAKSGNPVQRLGYSYWAESCYSYIGPLINKLREALSLKSSELTFFVAHSEIDAKHFDEIRGIIRRVCKTEDELDSIEHVAEKTLVMTATMLDAIYQEYCGLVQGRSSRYSALNLNSAV